MTIILIWCLFVGLLVSYFAGWHFIDVAKGKDTDNKAEFYVLSALCFCGTISDIMLGFLYIPF